MLLALLALVFVGPSFLWWALHGSSLGGWTRSPPEEQIREEWVRRHALTSDEVLEVVQAVRRGVLLPDARLRAAAAEWAQVLLSPVPSVSVRARRVWFGVAIVGVIGSVALGGYRLATDRAEDLNWFMLALTLAFVVWWVQRRARIRRALEVNRA